MITFAVVFDGGFALVDTCREVKAVMDNHFEILVKGFHTRQAAYVFCCYEHYRREFEKFPLMQPIFPKLEAFERLQVYCKPGFVPYGVASRVFAAVHSSYMGIMTSTESGIGFLEFLPMNSEIVEVESMAKAQNFLNYSYLKDIVPKSAYISDSIPYGDNIQPDIIIQVPYWDWMDQHCILPKNLPFTEGLLVSPIIKLREQPIMG